MLLRMAMDKKDYGVKIVWTESGNGIKSNFLSKSFTNEDRIIGALREFRKEIN